VLRNEIVDRARPGDKCVFTGNLIVVPDVGQLGAGRSAEMRGVAKSKSKDAMPADGMTGLKALGVRDLSYKLCFLSSMVQPADARVRLFFSLSPFFHCSKEPTNETQQTKIFQFGTVNIREDNDVEDSGVILQQFSPEEIEEIRQMKSQPQIYSKLINSIAPTVFGEAFFFFLSSPLFFLSSEQQLKWTWKLGHETVKKGVLLMLFGGVHKKTVGELNLRGDINVCIVGDPSTAKSQFLKYVLTSPSKKKKREKESSSSFLSQTQVRRELSSSCCLHFRKGFHRCGFDGLCGSR